MEGLGDIAQVRAWLLFAAANEVDLVPVLIADVGTVVSRTIARSGAGSTFVVRTGRYGRLVRGIYRSSRLRPECNHAPVARACGLLVVRQTNPELRLFARALPSRP